MQETANKGEWSELYAFFKIISEKHLKPGNNRGEYEEQIIYPIIQIIREENSAIFNYRYEGDIVIISDSGEERQRIPISEFTENASLLFNKIKSGPMKGHKSTFSIPEITKFRNKTFATKIKADSAKKADINIMIHDYQTGFTPTLGFSIKSEVGNNATLFNPGKTTNFIYELTNPVSEEVRESVNSERLFTKKIASIYDAGAELKYIGIEESSRYGKRFQNNLILIDCSMPKLIAYMLLYRYRYDIKQLSELTKKMGEENPLGLDLSDNHMFYEAKIKHLLIDIALGMTPGKVWNGEYEANGGYLIVKDTGDVVCYHLYDKRLFEDYLFYNTCLETPAPERYNFGELSSSGRFKLNLQIRFASGR